MNYRCVPVAALIFLGCAVFAAGQAPPDDDDFVFEGSGSTLSRTAGAEPAAVTPAPGRPAWLDDRSAAHDPDESSGSGLGADDDEDDGYDIYNEDYYDSYDYGDDGADGGDGITRDDAHKENVDHVGVVHALPPPHEVPAETPVHRSELTPVFGSENSHPEEPRTRMEDYPEERENDIVIAPEVTLTEMENEIEDDTVGGRPLGSHEGLGAKAVDRNTSFFAQPGILAAVVGGAVVGLLCAILLVMLIVYRMRKKDEGSYPVDEPKRSLTGDTYSKNYNKEFFA